MKNTFISICIMAAALITFSSCNKASENGIGLQLYSLRDDMSKDPVATIEKLGKTGYDFVEAADYNDGKFYGMSPADFKALVEKNGMIFLGSHAKHAIPDSGSWESLMPWWDQCIAAHKEAGVEFIVQPSLSDTAYNSIEGLRAYCDYFNAVGEKCNEAGIQFGFHNHDGEFKKIDGVTIYDYMMEHTDPENVM